MKKFISFVVFAFIVSLFLMMGCNVKSTGQKSVQNPEQNNGRGIDVVPSGKRYALLIGVNEYASPIKSLQFCVNDMKLLANCFQKIGTPEENIILVTDDSPVDRRPTGSIIRRQIENITRLMESEDQLIIAFSGHGVMVGNESYLCPCDTDLKNKNSIVSREWIFEKLDKCRAKQKVFIIDACRSDIAFDGGKALGQVRTLVDPIGADTHGFILIASCDKKQQSWEHPDIQHGVFTYFLAEGLSGEAKNDEGYVTILSLFQYTSSKTKMFVYHKLNEVQVPTFRQGGEMTDFCIAKMDSDLISSSLSSSQMSLSLPSVEQKPSLIPSPSQMHSTRLKAGDRQVYRIKGLEFAFRYCPPGSFMMGSPESEDGHFKWETQHEVTLTKGFWMMETEVTVGMFKAFVSDTGYESKGNTPTGKIGNTWGQNPNISWQNPGFSQDDNNPVTCVSVFDAEEFCKWLSKKIGQKITLSTEAQWEYACRAGTTGTYAGNIDEMAWYKDNSGNRTHPVGKKKPNAWGLYDMHGNVWEWCQDCFEPFSSESVSDPTGASTDPYYASIVYRGGGWCLDELACRSAFRGSNSRSLRSDSLGFRILISQ